MHSTTELDAPVTEKPVRTSLIDIAEVKRAYELLVQPGQVIEARMLKASFNLDNASYTIRGYFDNVTDLLQQITRVKKAKGFYFILNSINPTLMARAHNELKRVEQDNATQDTDVLSYRWLPIDIDIKRPEGVPSDSSATDKEKADSHALALHVMEKLSLYGWPSPIYADSGNGVHILYPINIASEDKGLIRRVLQGLADAFDNAPTHIDISIYNPARILKMYGTMACKGDSTTDRPHRMSSIISAPDARTLVTREQLEAIARPDAAKHVSISRGNASKGKSTFNLDAWITGNGIEILSRRDMSYAVVSRVECPFNPEHKGTDAAIYQFPNGGHTFKCSHSSCSMNSWHEFRELYEPGYKEKRQRTYTSNVQPDDLSIEQPSGATTGRFEIVLNEQDHIIRDQCIEALMQANSVHPTLFVQITGLVSIGKDAEGRGFTVQMGVHELKNALTNATDFFKLKKVAGTDDEFIKVPTSVPQNIAELILSLKPHEWPFKKLSAIVETPIIRPDGSILDTPGYDEATQLYYIPGKHMEHCTVPLHPTEQHIAHAIALIKQGIYQFPYEGAADYANALATPLTSIMRHHVQSDVQMTLVDATKPGTGKGKLTNYFSILATGARAVPIALPYRDEELEKRIDAKLMQGSPMLVIDNIDRKLVSTTLELILTTPYKDTRPLGTSNIVKVKNSATWVATGNNLQLGGDLARRCYRIRLVSPVSNPDERTDFEIEDLEEWTLENRPALVQAYLTLARAWIVAGKPKPKHVPNIGNFTKWAKTVGGILEYIGIEGFQANRAELKAESNIEEGECEAFLRAWEECFGSKLMLSKEIANTIREASEDTLDSDASSPKQLLAKALAESLPNELKEALAEKPKTLTMKLSKWLEKRVKTPYGPDNLRIVAVRDAHSHVNKWHVLRVVASSCGESNNFEKKATAEENQDEDKENIFIPPVVTQDTRNYSQGVNSTLVNHASHKDTSRVNSTLTGMDVASSTNQLLAGEAEQFIKGILAQPGHELRLDSLGQPILRAPKSVSDEEYEALVTQVEHHADAIKAYLRKQV